MAENNGINSDLNCDKTQTVSTSQNPNTSVNAGLNSYSGETQTSLREKGGIISWLFGTDTSVLARYIAFILCFILALVVWCGKPDVEALKCIVPVFTLSLGYIFGKEDKSSK